VLNREIPTAGAAVVPWRGQWLDGGIERWTGWPEAFGGRHSRGAPEADVGKGPVTGDKEHGDYGDNQEEKFNFFLENFFQEKRKKIRRGDRATVALGGRRQGRSDRAEEHFFSFFLEKIFEKKVEFFFLVVTVITVPYLIGKKKIRLYFLLNFQEKYLLVEKKRCSSSSEGRAFPDWIISSCIFRLLYFHPSCIFIPFHSGWGVR